MSTVDIYRLKKLAEELDSYSGSATSLVTVSITPGTSILNVGKKIADETCAAACIKSRL